MALRPFNLLDLGLFLLVLLLSCSPSPDSPPSDEGTVRERVELSGPISEDTVWESGKEYVVTGDVTVHAGVTLTIQPDVVVKFTQSWARRACGRVRCGFF